MMHDRSFAFDVLVMCPAVAYSFLADVITVHLILRVVCLSVSV